MIARHRGIGVPAWCVLAVIGAILVSACGAAAERGGDASGGTAVVMPRPLSDDEAARLAQAGYLNLQAGGARFEAHSAFLVGEPRETVSLVGELDWVRHAGRAMVQATGIDAGVTEVYWEDGVVLERRPAMDAIIAGQGGPAEPWIARPAEPETRQLDRLLTLSVALAMEQPDNALLIQQTEGSGYVRHDRLRNTSVEVLRYGTRNLHWLDRADGRLLRFEGNSSTGNAPTIIDLLEHGPVDLVRPPDADVVPIAAVAELYGVATGN